MNKKILGQFFTENDFWLKRQVSDFIKATKASIAYDPFAGSGCIFKALQERKFSFKKYIGLDIDKSLGYPYNDSLLNIPPQKNSIIITNPPYISNYSAARKKIDEKLKKYFQSTRYDDLYLLALDKMLEAAQHVVAIVPETFVNSSYAQKDKLQSITILEENPFNDTDVPVAVICFDSQSKDFSKIPVYKNEQLIDSLGNLEHFRLEPQNDIKIQFNALDGWLAVRCIDSTSSDKMISFNFKNDIDYDWNRRIKVSSRLLTLIHIEISSQKRSAFVQECNRILQELRKKTSDIIFSPFKGNMKDGRRRRRLDFKTCRAIIELAYKQVSSGEKNEQLTLF